MVHFPNQALIKYSLPPIESDPSCNLKRKTFQDVKVDTKRNQKKTALNPMDTMFNVLHRAKIDANASVISINMGKINYLLQNWWFMEKKIPIVIFKDTKYTIEKAPWPQTNRHAWILIEDFLLLAPS